jgi:hypothetical protein
VALFSGVNTLSKEISNSDSLPNGIIVSRCSNANCPNKIGEGEFMFVRIPTKTGEPTIGIIMCYPCGNAMLKAINFAKVIRDGGMERNEPTTYKTPDFIIDNPRKPDLIDIDQLRLRLNT